MTNINLTRLQLQHLLDNANLDFWALMQVNPDDISTLNCILHEPYIRVVDPEHDLVIFSFSLTVSGLRHDLKIHNFDFYSAFKGYIQEWEHHTFDGNPDLFDLRKGLLNRFCTLNVPHVYYE